MMAHVIEQMIELLAINTKVNLHRGECGCKSVCVWLRGLLLCGHFMLTCTKSMFLLFPALPKSFLTFQLLFGA